MNLKTIETFNLIGRYKTLLENNNFSNLNLTELLTLRLIVDNDNITLTEISEKLGVSKVAVSKTIVKLEKKGFLKRKINLNNRSTFKFFLKKNEYEIEKEKMIGFFQKVEEQIGEENILVLNDLMQKLIKFTEEILERNNWNVKIS